MALSQRPLSKNSPTCLQHKGSQLSKGELLATEVSVRNILGDFDLFQMEPEAVDEEHFNLRLRIDQIETVT